MRSNVSKMLERDSKLTGIKQPRRFNIVKVRRLKTRIS